MVILLKGYSGVSIFNKVITNTQNMIKSIIAINRTKNEDELSKMSREKSNEKYFLKFKQKNPTIESDVRGMRLYFGSKARIVYCEQRIKWKKCNIPFLVL